MAAVKVYSHPITGDSVLAVLEDLLPYSLPLFKRIQFHHRSPSSQIFATFPPSPLLLDQKTNDPHSTCFAAAFLDRTRRPETECWLFVSGEVPGRCSLSSADKQCQDCQDAFLAIIDQLMHSDVPESIHGVGQLSQSDPGMQRSLDGEVLLIGAMHEVCHAMLKRSMPERVVPPPVQGIDEGWIKYLFKVESLPEPKDLPTGFRWGPVRHHDFELVRNRTAIPRQDATLALLPSLAIFRTDEVDSPPVAWAFLGPDSSLTSLHTEIECRGRGFAKTLVTKLFTEGGFCGGSVDGEDRHGRRGMAHADTGIDNGSSRAVCRALGGKEGWLVYWTRIDVTKSSPIELSNGI